MRPRGRHGTPFERPDRGTWLAWWRMRRGLRRRLFVAFGLAILLSIALTAFVHRTIGHSHASRPLALVCTFVFLWGFAGWVSRWLTFPLVRLVAIVRSFGEGKLDRRADVSARAPAEVRELGRAFDAMAERIEGQIRGQRELMAAVSHELRTPLARMRLLVELGRERGDDPRTAADLEREIEAMDALVGGLLAGARLDAGALTRRAVDLVEVARQAVVRATERDASRSYALEAEAERVVVQADPALVARALSILLDNAEKHGGSDIVVRVRGGSAPELAVEDDGPGIAESDRERVFSPFVRGRDADHDERRGVGLGLHLVRRIAEAHGGRAWAEAAPSGGARVALSFDANPDVARGEQR